MERVTRIELALSAWESVSRERGNAYGIGTFSVGSRGSCNERATRRTYERPGGLGREDWSWPRSRAISGA